MNDCRSCLADEEISNTGEDGNSEASSFRRPTTFKTAGGRKKPLLQSHNVQRDPWLVLGCYVVEKYCRVYHLNGYNNV